MELSDKLFALYRERDKLNASLEKIKESIEHTENQLIHWMENSGVRQVKDENGTLFFRVVTYAKIENPDMAFGWMRMNGYEDIIQTSVHAKRLASLVKEKGEIPGVTATYETKIGRRSNGGGE